MQMIIGNWQGTPGEFFAPRELEAVLHCANDRTLKQTAKEMHISPDTVAKRLMNARFKVGAKTIRGLVLESFKRGMIMPACLAFLAVLLGAMPAQQVTIARRPESPRRVETRPAQRRLEEHFSSTDLCA